MQKMDCDSFRKKMVGNSRPIRMIEMTDEMESFIPDMEDDIRKTIQESSREITKVRLSK